jgi:hypothetical protein
MVPIILTLPEVSNSLACRKKRLKAFKLYPLLTTVVEHNIACNQHISTNHQREINMRFLINEFETQH